MGQLFKGLEKGQKARLPKDGADQFSNLEKTEAFIRLKEGLDEGLAKIRETNEKAKNAEGLAVYGLWVALIALASIWIEVALQKTSSYNALLERVISLEQTNLPE